MAKRDGTGQMRMGANTERGMENCNATNNSSAVQEDLSKEQKADFEQKLKLINDQFIR